jgi:hypothetical protein
VHVHVYIELYYETETKGIAMELMTIKEGKGEKIEDKSIYIVYMYLL